MKQNIRMREVVERVNMKVKITGGTEYIVRRYIGLRLIKLGAKVIGCSMVIDQQPKK